MLKQVVLMFDRLPSCCIPYQRLYDLPWSKIATLVENEAFSNTITNRYGKLSFCG